MKPDGPTFQGGPFPSVPRSKGCINCVARKSRCDGRRPTCKSCEERKQQCRGYRRGDFVFMSDGWRAPGVAAGKANGPPGAATRTGPRTCAGGLETPHTPPASQEASRKDDMPRVLQEDCRNNYKITGIVLSRPLTPEPLAIYVSFFLSQFTLDPPRPSRVMVQCLRQYFGQLLDRPPLPGVKTHPVTEAAEALVKTYFGRLHGSDLLIRESICSYVRALKSLYSRLDEVQSVGLVCLEEDDWTRLAFACLFLTFWELTMHPNGTAWQKHARGLANLVEGRGPQGFRSPSGLELIGSLRMLILLESISSKRRTFLSREGWQSFRDFRWPGSPAMVAQSIIRAVESGGPKHYLDYLVNELVTISNLTADFAELRDADLSARCPSRTQASLSESVGALRRLELVLAHIQEEVGIFSPYVPSRQPSSGGTSAQAAVLTKTHNNSPSGRGRTLPSSSSAQLLKYNLVGLCRTAAMTLRLLMCDLINQQGGEIADGDRLLHEQRGSLMVHAEAVLEAIPYSYRSEIFDVTPMCFVAAFRLAEAVLVRESDALQREVRRNESALAKCNSMKDLVRCHLEYVASKKICVKIDV